MVIKSVNYFCDNCKCQVESESQLFEFVNYSIANRFDKTHSCFDTVDAYQFDNIRLSKENIMVCSICLNKNKKTYKK